MTVDKNEAPEGYEAVADVSDACNAACALVGEDMCWSARCSRFERKDNTSCYFIKKERLEKAMEEYEHMTANTQEAWRTIVDAIFRGDCEIKRNAGKYNKAGEFEVSIVWDRATHIEHNREYRWKKPAPPKVKKLVDRTAEELIPLIGHIARKKRDGLYFMITSNQVFDQENMEIAPLGSDDWQPMQVLKECEA